MSNLDNIINKIIEAAKHMAALIKEEARESAVDRREEWLRRPEAKALKRAEVEAAMTTEESSECRFEITRYVTQRSKALLLVF